MAPISFNWDGTDITWHLSSYLLTFNSSMTERLCPKDMKMIFDFTTPAVISDADLRTVLDGFANFTKISATRVTYLMIRYKNQVKRQTGGLEAELEVLINAANETYAGEPSAEDTVIDFINNARQNTSIADPFLNPNSTEGRDLVDVKPFNGNELPGMPVQIQVLPTPTPNSNEVPSTATPHVRNQVSGSSSVLHLSPTKVILIALGIITLFII